MHAQQVLSMDLETDSKRPLVGLVTFMLILHVPVVDIVDSELAEDSCDDSITSAAEICCMTG